jgi:hypothetical protein
MLRHAHFYMKGGKQTFAAVCLEVCSARQTGLVQTQLSLMQHCFATAAREFRWRGKFPQTSRSILSEQVESKQSLSALQKPAYKNVSTHSYQPPTDDQKGRASIFHLSMQLNARAACPNRIALAAPRMCALAAGTAKSIQVCLHIHSKGYSRSRVFLW